MYCSHIVRWYIYSLLSRYCIHMNFCMCVCVCGWIFSLYCKENFSLWQNHYSFDLLIFIGNYCVCCNFYSLLINYCWRKMFKQFKGYLMNEWFTSMWTFIYSFEFFHIKPFFCKSWFITEICNYFSLKSVIFCIQKNIEQVIG